MSDAAPPGPRRSAEPPAPAASALRESEERYRRLVESIDDYAVFEMDLERRVTLWNEGAQRILGWTEAEMLGETGDVIFTAEDRATDEPGNEARTALADGRAMDERWHIRRDGTRFWGSGAMMVIEGTDGRPRAFVKVVRDATARRIQEVALRVSELRFRMVANLVPDLLWQSEADGAVRWYNDRWYEYTGQAPADAAGFGWMELVHPDDLPRTRARWDDAVRTGFPYDTEHRLRRSDGTYRWFLVRAEPLHDETGRIMQWLGANTDVHEQRAALDEATSARRDVERRVAERTHELAQANTALEAAFAERALAEAERNALRLQLARAEEAERRRIAQELHDQLGQHLTALTLGLEEIRQLAATEPAAQSRLERLQDLAQAMTRDARGLALELRPPELDDVGLEGALTTYVSEWSQRYRVQADVEVSGLREAPLTPDVGTTLYRIVQEALTNVARHATATHASVILERADGEVRLIVEDNGRGFEPAPTLARARAERRLGLAGMRERAVLVGGTLVIESSPGVGTTVFVRLPPSR